mmetsp:Transcript_101577/g.242180  ORF Transcript_101577/g.242180 Transcript_101577/m.242180 type:complete len:233 (+) Transcript_101577:1094-1792(+)
MQDLALEFRCVSSQGDVRRPAVHPSRDHQVVKGFGGALLFLLEDHRPASLPARRLQFDDRGLELCDVVELEGFGIQLDVCLYLRSRGEEIALEVVGVGEVRELKKLFGNLKAEVCIVLLPTAAHILGLLEDGARDPNLHEPSSHLQSGDSGADNGDGLHMTKVVLDCWKHCFCNASTERFGLLGGGVQELMDAIHELVLIQDPVVIVVDHLEDTPEDGGIVQASQLLRELAG